MHTFTDCEKREWSLVVTIATIRRVRELVGVDLMQVAGGNLMERLSDPIVLADVLYAICKPQADARSVSAESFGESLLGDAIDHATTALLAGLADFFPSQTRTLLHRVVDAAKTQQSKAIDLAAARLDQLMKPGQSLPSALESSDSTQDT